MKKISVLLLAAMMLFAFTACDGSTPEAPTMSEEALAEAISSAGDNGTVTLTGNVTATNAIEISKAITLDGAGYTITRDNSGASTGNPNDGSKSVVFVNGANATIKNLTVSGTNPRAAWDAGEFGIMICEGANATLENVTVTKMNAGIQVCSATATVNGTITVTGNVYGGISVDQESGNKTKGKLIISNGAKIVCADEKVPAIWLESTAKADIVGADGFTSFDRKNDQVYYLAEGQSKDNFFDAKIGDTYYFTLDEAIANATSGDTVILLRDASGKGIGSKDQGIYDQSRGRLIIDFNGHTYTMTDPAVGSTGTETQAMHWGTGLGSVTMKNGKFQVAEEAEGVKMAMQNYIDFTAEDMIFDFSNIPVGRYAGSLYGDYNGLEIPMFNNNKAGVMKLNKCTVIMPAESTKGISAGGKSVTLTDSTIDGYICLEPECSVTLKNTGAKDVVAYFDGDTVTSTVEEDGSTTYKCVDASVTPVASAN